MISSLFKSKNKNLGKTSYSQMGEDLIVNFLAEVLKLEHFTYLDIGAHHPTEISNTYFFYQKGLRGVCIEPDPDLHRNYKQERPEDVVLNIGIGTGKETEGQFYVMSTPSLNTFSKEEADRYTSYGTVSIKNTLTIPLHNINDIISKHFDKCPSFISLDTEGMDFEILQSINFTLYRPTVFCIETITYTEDNSEEKLDYIIEFMKDHGYLNFADTYINTIFVDQRTWQTR